MQTTRNVIRASLATLASITAAAGAATISWDSSTGSQPWLTGSNWIGGAYPGEGNNALSTNTDVASFSNAAADVNPQIDFSSSGVNGEFALGAIVVDNTTGSSNYSTQRINANGRITFNGATVNGVPNTILACFSSSGPTGGSPFSALLISNDLSTTLRLGGTTNVIQVVPGRVVNTGPQIPISETVAGSGLTITGGGAFSATATNTFSGVVTVKGGSTFAPGGTFQGLGTSSAGDASNVVLNSGTLANLTGTTSRLFTMAGDATITTSPAATTANFSNTGALAVTATTNRTLTLNHQGSLGTFQFSPQITDGASGKTSLTTASLVSSRPVNLNAANTYTGTTTVSKGALSLGASGSIANSPIINLLIASSRFNVSTVAGGSNFDGTRFALMNGQTLNGIGSVVGAMNVSGGATVAPGNSIGTLSTQSIYFTSTPSKFAAEIDLGSILAADLLSVTGTVSLNNSTLDISLLNL
ncbi:MAG TPA: hypothetical protein PK402_02885, partial [Tepidisphaeraceae bacterium]|nr:hypothetical protein [Tepidisphaeraceae bacterium]